MADENEDIDLEQIVWDPRYRRSVIEQLNRDARKSTPSPEVPPPEPKPEPSR
jgi:hypothetical protein